MINHGKVRSTIKPESMVIDEYSVWIHEDIQEIEVSNEPNDESETKTHIEYEYTMIQYDKNEYIMNQAQQITDTEMALCEIYESLGV